LVWKRVICFLFRWVEGAMGPHTPMVRNSRP
jgi:hypothetical protein